MGETVAKLRAWFEEARTGLGREEGQTLVEYALMIGFIGMATIGAMIALGPGIGHSFEMIGQVIEDYGVL